MYMVMQPSGMQPITEKKHAGVHPGNQDEYGGVYETMVQNERQEGYTTLRSNGSARSLQVGVGKFRKFLTRAISSVLIQGVARSSPFHF